MFMAGCSSMNMVERSTPEANLQMVNDKRVITNDALNDYAYIAGVNQAFVGGLLQVQVKLVNSTSSARQVRYQFVWLNENGMQVNSVTSHWETIEIAAGEARNITAIATDKRVKDFTVKLLPVED